MVVKNIELEGFRNYEHGIAEFSENVNVLIGDNAQGKTNLLEAIYYLTGGKSFKARSDKEIIGFHRDYAIVKANARAQGRDHRIEIKLIRGRRKQLFLNGVKLKTAAELSGNFSAVLFCPDDLYMIKEGAAARRRLMDMAISQLRPRYAALLSEFNRVYEHKTRILRDYEEKPSLLETLDDFSFQLAKLSAEMIHYRAHFVKKLAKFAASIHSEFSKGAEELSLSYQTVKTITDPYAAPSQLLQQILVHQAEHKRAEMDTGLCLTGAHKDDIFISINGQPAKNFASQGQTRTAALSIKLAEREIHFDNFGEYPVLLLDDVLSELDAGRQNFILNRIAGGQIFITCCEGGSIAEKTGGKVLRIEKGEIC